MGALSDSDEKNGSVVTYSFSRVSLSYHLSEVCLLFGIRLFLQVLLKTLNRFPSFTRNLSCTEICPGLSLHLQPEEQNSGFVAGNVSNSWSDMVYVEYITAFIHDRKGVP